MSTCLFKEGKSPDSLHEQEGSEDAPGDSIVLPKQASSRVEMNAACWPKGLELPNQYDHENYL